MSAMASIPLRGELRKRESLAHYTSWRVGGIADCVYIAADLADLQNFLKTLPITEPIYWLGLGSNTLIRDGGIRGTVIITRSSLQELAQLENGTWRAEAGVSCGQLSRHAARKLYVGSEFLAGIPGTIGGALAMNAGAFGGETWQQVVAVECINRQGEITLRLPSEFTIKYREINWPQKKQEWFVAGHFQFQLSSITVSHQTPLQRIKQLIDHRNQTQPTNEPNCGSVFRNPEGHYAGQLIELSELKGFQIGGAMVSPKHANFILNVGGARAHDIETLINHIRTTVYTKQQIQLLPEVHILGEP